MSKAFLSTLIFLLPAAVIAQAEQLENPGTVLAVQDREYRKNHEVTLAIGALPLDAFYKGYIAQVGYTFHFTDTFAWQVGRFAYSFDVDTGLKSQLFNQWGVTPTQFPEVQWMAGSDLVWTPIYGKISFLNRSVTHFEVFLLAGATVFDLTNVPGLPFRPGVNLGLGARLFITQHVSFRLDVTDNVVLGEKIFNVGSVQLAAAINFGATE